MARSLRDAARPASASEVGDWVRSIAGETLRMRTEVITRIERESTEAPTEGPVALPPPSDMAKPRRHVRVVLLAGGLATLTAAALYASRSTDAPGLAKREAPAASSDKLGIDSSTPQPVTAGSPALQPLPLQSPSLAPTQAPSAAAVPKSPAPVQPTVKRAARPPPTDCDPPYTTDADGTRRYKLKCL